MLYKRILAEAQAGLLLRVAKSKGWTIRPNDSGYELGKSEIALHCPSNTCSQWQVSCPLDESDELESLLADAIDEGENEYEP